MNLTTLLGPVGAWLNSQPWARPVLMVLTAIALSVQQFSHNPTALSVAGKALIVLIALGAGSVGQSNSGVAAGQGVAAPKAP